MTPPHRIVVVDDQPDEVVGLVDELRRYELDVLVREPDQLSLSDIASGRLFVLDMYIEEWPGRDKLPAAAQLQDGIALASVIRSQARQAERHMPVITLNTGHPEKLSLLPREIREHALARSHALEWVFAKNESVSGVTTSRRIAQLASAQEALPTHWRDEAAEITLLRLLGAHEDELDEVLECWPPIREVARDSAGISLLRWLLHRIQPYPCFLIDRLHLAARLGVTVESLDSLIDEQSDLATALKGCAYSGILHEFEGRRWWRGRVEQLLWRLSGGRRPASIEQLQALANTQLMPLSVSRGVVVVGADYTPHEPAADIEDAVRIQLDDWPPYAEPAWALISEVKNDPLLAQRVWPGDRDRLS